MTSKGSLASRLAPLDTLAFAALRIVSGTLFFFHGAQKLFGVLATHAGPPAFSQLWFGGIIELVGGALVAVGLFTRCAAFVASGMTAVAYFQFHWKLQFGAKFFPIANQGELAVLYCFVFFFVFVHGPGRASLDGLRARR